MNRGWILATLALAAVACGDTHTEDDGASDMRVGCLMDALPPPACYLDACCEAVEPATLNTATCEWECTRGSRSCTPAPGCGDDCGSADAGPIAPCYGGPCCDEQRAPTYGPGCSLECPTGYAFLCEPDPAALCAPDPRACAAPSDCAVTANTCCGECGQATLAGSTAIHTDHLASYRDELCADDPLCPGCPTAPNPELVATCAASRCEVVDLGMDPITECTSASECVVRTVACCECGGPTDPGSLIAIRADSRAAYEGLVCDPGTACAECLPDYPGDVTATCDAGHCALVYGAP